MGREIKFRAWHNVDGWCGAFSVHQSGLIDYGSGWKTPEEANMVLMQFTGLKDKNGKEIYEGDILASEGRVIGHIEGGVRGYCYDVVYLNPRHDKRWSLYASVTDDYEGNIVVIGNIHETPELLQS